MCFSFCKYEKEKLTLLSQNLVQQTDPNYIFRSKDTNSKCYFHQQKFPSLATVSLQNSHFLLIFDIFRGKNHFSETSKCVIGKKLLGSNGSYISYPMKFALYLHQVYGY